MDALIILAGSIVCVLFIYFSYLMLRATSLRWILTSENWFAKWLREDETWWTERNSRSPKFSRNIQERINEVEFQVLNKEICVEKAEKEYEKIYQEIIKQNG